LDKLRNVLLQKDQNEHMIIIINKIEECIKVLKERIDYYKKKDQCEFEVLYSSLMKEKLRIAQNNTTFSDKIDSFYNIKEDGRTVNSDKRLVRTNMHPKEEMIIKKEDFKNDLIKNDVIVKSSGVNFNDI
jgi:hypothetical protein